MTERTAIVLGAVLGAALGGVAGFVLLTERGQRLRQDVEPRLTELVRELVELQAAFNRARTAADAGLRTTNDVSARQRLAEPASV